MKLFNTYCMSCYGWVLWDFKSNEFAGICFKWRQSIRKLLNIIPTIHNNLIAGNIKDLLHMGDTSSLRKTKCNVC